MFLPYRRHGLVVALALVTGISSLVVQPRVAVPSLPTAASVTRGTGWRLAATYQGGGWSGLVYGEWRLRDGGGDDATLYLAVTTQVQKMIHWSGELAYLGAGYQVVSRGVRSVQSPSGVTPTSVVTVQRLADRQVLEYAIVGPDGVAAYATYNPLRIAWDTLRGASGPYYLVRLSVPGRLGSYAANVAATRLLAPILSTLKAGERGGLS